MSDTHKGPSLTGQRFGRLVVLAFAGRDRFQALRWLCLCDCGKQHTATARAMRQGAKGPRRGGVTSCGCARGRPRAGQRKGELCKQCEEKIAVDGYFCGKPCQDAYEADAAAGVVPWLGTR